MSIQYFSDRESGPTARTTEEINNVPWGGIVAIMRARLSDNSFAYDYPEQCPDNYGVCGCDGLSFRLALRAEIPQVNWPPNEDELPNTLPILDLIEFCHRVIAKPIQGSYHDYFQHHHLSFNRENGQEAFRTSINRILARNGIAFELKETGQIERLAPIILREALHTVRFETGDLELDGLLNASRIKYLDPDPVVRMEALEKLWDASERLKTLEPANNKRESVGQILDIAAREPHFRELLETESRELTRIGNQFRIRHSETTQISLQLDEHVDYLFHRLFSLIRLLLQVTNRLGS